MAAVLALGAFSTQQCGHQSGSGVSTGDVQWGFGDPRKQYASVGLSGPQENAWEPHITAWKLARFPTGFSLFHGARVISVASHFPASCCQASALVRNP